MDVDIFPLLRRVLENTKKRVCNWEKAGQDTYRLLLRSGSITIKKGVEPFISIPLDPVILYSVRLFDQNECFYSLDVVKRESEEYAIVNELFQAIRDEENRRINEKISLLLNEI